MTDPDQTRRALELFKRARLCAAAEREALIDEACAGDGELRTVVLAMLRADEVDERGSEAGEPFTGAERLVAAGVVGDLALPRRLGPYTLLERIGEGGFGTVYVAEQREPVARRVALKVVKLGMDSPQVVARFEQERQALALMEHPNIARVIDAGTTDSGRPYFVMDLVDGVPITEYCDRNRLRVEQRLELFAQVCLAVQHAHMKGIIHRDLKPSNVLVSTVDERPLAKVIDFGIAKAIEHELSAGTRLTEHHQLVGTPEYMSPEQAEGTADIDTRSDVYALGVLLYELVTGSTPFQRSELRRAAYGEIQRILREVDPPRPSALLRDSGDTLASVAACRHVEPRRLTALVHGELDWIVMKPLEKERDRRYQSARDLARDVERYLAGDAVEARPPSTGYRLGKFLRRNRAAVLATLLLFLVLLAGVVGTTWGLLEARRSAEVATRRLERLERGVGILGSIFAGLDPMTEDKGEPLAAALARQLDRAVEELRGDAIGDPLVTARLQEELAASLVGLGRSGPAAAVLEDVVETRRTALGEEDRATLRSRVALASACGTAGDLARARAILEQVLPVLARDAAEDDELLLHGRTEYARMLAELGHVEQGTAEFLAVLELYRAAGRAEDPAALRTSGRLAYAYLECQDFKRAVPLLEELLPRYEAAYGAEHPDTLGLRNDLAMAYQQAGDYVRCIPLLQEVHEDLILRLGADHPRTLTCLHNLAMAQRVAGEIHHAVPIFERLVSIYGARFGASHPTTLRAISELAAAHTSLGDYPRARELYEEALATAPPLERSDELWSANLRLGLAHALNRTGENERALSLFEEVLTTFAGTELARTPSLIRSHFQWVETLSEVNQHRRGIEIGRGALQEAEAHLGADHPVTMYGRNALSYAYRYAGEIENALPLLERNLEANVRELGAEHPQAIITRVNFASAVRDAGDLPRALTLMEEGIGQSERTNGPEHAITLQIREIRCDTLEDALDWEAAIAERRALLAIRRAQGERDTHLAWSLYYLGQAMHGSGRPAEGEAHLRECLEILLAVEPDTWTTYNAMAVLGATLLALERFDEAEPLLADGYRGMQERAEAISRPSWRRVLAAAEWLVELYERTERPEERGRWAAELERARAQREG